MACIALGAGCAVTAVLLLLTDPARNTTYVYVAAHDVPAGAQLGTDSLVLAQVEGVADLSQLFRRADARALASLHATHDLSSGQLIQRSDVGDAAQATDSRLVFVPLKDVPPVVAGAKVDLLYVDDAPTGATVQPFATAIQVRAAMPGGLVVVVSARQAAAFVYAAGNMHLVAAVAEPGSVTGAEVPVATRDQAIEMAGQG